MQAVDREQRGARRGRPRLTDPATALRESENLRDQEGELTRLLGTLTAQQRAFLESRFLKQMSLPEMAERFGGSAEAVRKRIERLLAKLRELRN